MGALFGVVGRRGSGYRCAVPLVPQAKPERSAALADLDEVLRTLVETELEKVGMTGVTISFESPVRERTAAWPSPAINLFLYDLREAAGSRGRGFHERSPSGLPGAPGRVMARDPLRLACTFAITVWTREVRDEHQILSQLLSILLAYPTIPPDRLPPSLLVGAPGAGLSTRVGHAKEEGRADFWTAIGSPYKVSLEYTVTILCDPGIHMERGPRVARTGLTGVLGDAHGFPSDEVHALSGRVTDASGAGISDAWVVISPGGAWIATGPDGGFFYYGLVAGDYTIDVRGAGGAAATARATVPMVAPGLELRLEVAG
jgi:uncharacterized protein DUF4255/carboxypeptidase family protein